MNLLAAPVTLVSPTSRLTGWRGVLRDGDRTVWRCECPPHARSELATECATAHLSKRDSGFYPGRDYMDEWLPTPGSDEERQALVAQIQTLRPTTSDDAMDQLVAHRSAILRAEGYDEIRLYQGAASAIKEMWRANKEVRQQFEHTYLLGEWRIGQELLRQERDGEEAAGTRGDFLGRDASGGFVRERPEGRNDAATLAEKVGNRTYGWRLKTIGPLSLEALASAIREAQRGDKEASLSGIVRILRAEEAAMRRLDSLTTPALTNGYDYRVGDCRVALSDIEDDSVALILTDPPYGHDGLELYRWLAEFAARVLIPGGSLICYTGQGLLFRDWQIFNQHLTYRWTCAMLHDNSQKMFGATVFAKWKPVLWFVKEFRRGPLTLVPDLVNSKRDKSQHEWGQGSGGVEQWVHHLTEPRELIVDPFAGTGEWGRIACSVGRRWIGSDVVFGGTTTAITEDQTEGTIV